MIFNIFLRVSITVIAIWLSDKSVFIRYLIVLFSFEDFDICFLFCTFCVLIIMYHEEFLL